LYIVQHRHVVEKKSHSTLVPGARFWRWKFDAINVIIEESRNIVQS
jgi:hypothetical protein